MGKQNWICTVDELLAATNGQPLSLVTQEFSRIGTDTRKSLAGQLFIPLTGENFDAHNFVPQAVAQKAAVILVHEWREEWRPLAAQATFVRVADTLLALQNLARHWRKKHKFKVIGITGSNGKTSTKEFAHALINESFPTHASKASFNNHWGVPLSILDAGPDDRVLILEMGMNKAGEIWRLCQIAEPDIVTVTSVGRAHVGELGSQANVAQAKEEIYLSSPNAVHVFNMDNEWTIRMQSRSHAKQFLFSSFRADVDVNFRAQRLSWDGLDVTGNINGVGGHTWVHVFGRQNTVNLMCAASLAVAAGVPPEEIWRRLANIHDSAWGRNQILPLRNGARVLFDGYNANPDSLTALLKNLYEMEVEGEKYLVVGDMLELGTFSEAAHEEAGEKAGGVGFSGIWFVGQNAAAFRRGLEKSSKSISFVDSPDFDSAVSAEFGAKFRAGDLVAVKASRGMALERAVVSWPLEQPLAPKP